MGKAMRPCSGKWPRNSWVCPSTRCASPMVTPMRSITAAAEKVIARGKEIAAHLLEASALDIEFSDGRFRVAGTDRGIDLAEVAKASFLPPKMPKGMELGLQGGAVIAPSDASFPNGCHVCEVEIDPETGVTQMVRYTVVDDVGRVVNP